MDDLLVLLLLAFLGSVAGLVGGVLFFLKRSWAHTLSDYSMPLAAGVLLAVSLTELIPEAVEEYGENTYLVILIVFVVVYVIERFLFTLHHHEHLRNKIQSAVPLVIIGDTIHNFLDGVTIAAAYMVEPFLGLVVALSAFLHETPHEIADFGILLSAKWSRTKAFVANFMSALATFPGAILVYVSSQSEHFDTGILLAIAASLFLYVSTTDFLPSVDMDAPKPRHSQVFAFVAGVLVILLVNLLLPEIGH